MRRVLSKPVVVFHTLLVAIALLVAQQVPPPQGDPQGDPQQVPESAPAAIAESGLLPVFGGTLELEKNWVDGKKFPSDQPNSGVSDALEQLYATQIAPCGFNVLRVPVDVSDSKPDQANRIANLAVWAAGKGLKLTPILTGGEIGKPFSKDYAAKAKSFVSAVIANLKKNENAQLAAYQTIASYQLDYPLNSPAYHGSVAAEDAAAALKQAAIDIRTVETEALTEFGLNPTQLTAAASFDFELLKNGAFPGTELNPEAYGLAFEGLKGYLGLLADSSEIGTVNVEWYPGSLSSDATEKLSELVRGLLTDVQGKILVLTTGYSTAFRSSEDQSRFYAMGFANLADIRASEGVDCPFVGIQWNTIIDGSGANVAPPSEQTAANMAKWDLSSKAAELVQMWQSGGGDPDLAWWWKKTRSSFGILSGTDGNTPKQAHQVLTELQAATAQAAVESGAAEAAQKLEEAQAQAAQGQPDPNAPPVDPNTGLPIDPNTGLPIDPNNPPIDPNTGLPINPGGGAPTGNSIADELKNTLNGALSQLITGIIDKGKQGLTNIIGRLLGDPTLSTPGFDPNAGFPPADPGSGQAIDPNTGFPIDPNTGLPIDPNTGQPVDPGAGGAGGGAPAGGGSGMADLVVEGGVPPLGALTTNVPINLNVTMKNNGDSPANGATAYLVDTENNAFAASEQTTLQPGASSVAVISFTPPSAGSIPGIKVLLFCENETNTADNSADLGSATITDPPGGVDTGVEPEPDPGGGTGGGGGVGGGVKPGGGIRPGGIKPGLINVRPLPPGVLAGLRPKIGVSLRPPGIVPQLSLIRPGMFNIGTVLPGTSAKLVQKLGGLMAGDGAEAQKSIGYPVGQPVPLTVPMTNPFKRPFRNVRATMLVNGSSLATKNMGMVMPKQTKTVSFNDFKPSAPGLYKIEVRLEAIGLKNATQIARAACQINVLDNKESSPLIRPGVIPSAGGGAAAGQIGRPKIMLARPSFGLVPTVVRTSIIRPMINLPTIPTRPGSLPTRGFTLPVIATMSAPAGATVAVGANDIGISPFPPAENASVAVSVGVRNGGLAPAKGVKVEAFLDNKSLKSQTLDVPAGQQAIANRFDKFPATMGTHTLKVVTTFGGKTQESSRSFEVKKGVLIARPLFNFTMSASVAFTGNDIQLNPIPQPGKPTRLSVNVRNPGGTAAANVQFEAFADGKSLGKVTKTIGPLQSATVDGFPEWAPPAGSHIVKVMATVARRQIAAEKTLNVINTIPLKTIVRPAFTLTRPNLTGLRPIGITPGRTNPAGGNPATVPGGIRPTIGGITRPGSSAVDVGVAVDDIKLSPPNPKSDQDVVIQVTVHNFGAKEASGAMLGISYVVDRNAPKTLNLPVTVPAGQTKLQNWKVRLPAGARLSVAARVTHKEDTNNQNSTATLTVDLNKEPGPIRPIIPGGGIRPGGGEIKPPIGGGLIPRPGLLSGPDVAVTSADISYAPSSVKENDTLNFTVRVQNLGKAAANGAKLTLVLNKDGAQHETKEFTLNIAAGQSATQQYSVKVPRARQLQLQAAVQVAGDSNAANGQASLTVNVIQPIIPIRPGGISPVVPGRIPTGIQPMFTPDLALGAGSVQASVRTAKQGETIKFKVKVQNVGKGSAKGATLTVRFFVDRRAAGVQEAKIDVAPNATVEREFQFKVPVGAQVQCSASVVANGDGNTGNNSASVAIAIVKS